MTRSLTSPRPTARAGVATFAAVLAAVLGATLLAGVATAPGAEAAAKPRLSIGSTGKYVLKVQRILAVRPKTGYYGPITEARVKRFQKRYSIERTGVVGPVTWAAIERHVAIYRKKASRSRSKPTGVAALNWRALAACESGGNPRAVNPYGYYGLYQFSVPTWRSVGGSGYPHHASPAEQTVRAHKLYKRTGASSWPTCGPRLFT